MWPFKKKEVFKQKTTSEVIQGFQELKYIPSAGYATDLSNLRLIELMTDKHKYELNDITSAILASIQRGTRTAQSSISWSDHDDFQYKTWKRHEAEKIANDIKRILEGKGYKIEIVDDEAEGKKERERLKKEFDAAKEAALKAAKTLKAKKKVKKDFGLNGEYTKKAVHWYSVSFSIKVSW